MLGLKLRTKLFSNRFIKRRTPTILLNYTKRDYSSQFFWSVVTIIIQRENCIQISVFKLDFRTSKVIHDIFVTRQIHGQNRL